MKEKNTVKQVQESWSSSSFCNKNKRHIETMQSWKEIVCWHLSAVFLQKKKNKIQERERGQEGRKYTGYETNPFLLVVAHTFYVQKVIFVPRARVVHFQ